ncbi:MAG: hypothetical protein COV60_00785 [Candidatus Magasanikbacteria bacterium CG11_big_fil_rev_8_21_14_0_20_43_7]|uniref:DUF2283 domain-containing protein n=1 Tax=Candidatus Magasanikbacteria bacterium CG11_big_fil_rev_8_21_14_0_20_43_7 TaxID=1974654 RepID=A0A2H0N3A4_9BACT|nr:MAG: hypothetical protein COV60_00785 [Candidatus Magasanikbacteria bacterium CG11_big_fil_rev_8_21_14_0_20_43_7]
MKFHFDKKKDALSIQFSDLPYDESDEVEDGIIFDYDKEGKLISIEILNASKKLSPSFQSELRQKHIALAIE